jgi:hypothetical protein
VQIDGVFRVAKAYCLPYAPPAWLTPRRIVIGALIWVPFGSLVDSVVSFPAALPWAVLQLAIAVPLAMWLVRAKTSMVAFGRTLVGSLPFTIVGLGFFGWLEDAKKHLYVAWGHWVGETYGWLGVISFAKLVFVAMLIHIIVLAWQTLLLTRTLRFRSQVPAHDAVDRTLRTAAILMTPLGLLAAVYIGATRNVAALSAWLSVLGMLVAPGVVAGLATVRISGRRNWLRCVFEGREPKWRVVASKETSTLPLIETSSSTETRRVLVRVEDPQDPYREAMLEIPVASVAEP